MILDIQNQWIWISLFPRCAETNKSSQQAKYIESKDVTSNRIYSMDDRHWEEKLKVK